MRDMTEILSSLRDPGAPEAAGEDVVAADVARGHHALLGRRRRRFAGSGIAAVAVAVAALGASQLAGSGSGGATSTAVGATDTAHVLLTSYTGSQPVGFRVDTVPAGWRVVSSTKDLFLVVPPHASVPPVKRPGAVALTNGIAVMLKARSRLPGGAAKVTVDGRQGRLGLTVDKKAEWLVFPDAAGRQVLVQVPTTLGLTDDQIVRFAQGVTVTDQAHSING